MHAPADRVAKRLSVEDWFVRYDAAELPRPRAVGPRVQTPKYTPPADRIAVRA